MDGGLEAQLRQYLLTRPISEALGSRKRLCRLEALDQLRQAGRGPALPLEFTSQYGEDCWLWELFRGQDDGFFIEAGAYDGFTASVSFPFEALGWKGLLVEPTPEHFQSAKTRRPGSRVVHAALGPPGSNGQTAFTVFEGGDVGMMSHLSGEADHDPKSNPPGAKTRTASVPLTSMNDLLAGHKGPIDFAAIDVEGFEISVLQGFDLSRFRPRVLLVEDGLPKAESPVTQYLSQFPYTQVAYAWVNRVYVRSDETALIDRAMRIPIW